jgi:Na+/H+ antiporter NhaD/arsenite permease-like protein
MEHSLATMLPLYSVTPFIGMLLSIALGPVLAPHFWERHFGKIALAWAMVVALPMIFAYRELAIHELLHILLVDYIPFIILLAALFTVGGGILVRTTLKGTTLVNAAFLTIGSLLASWMGTTGAAMLLIRPFLRVNKHRKYRAFMVVFFIFMVANIGGALTPLGDPPLFLGFLHGVPFFWTLHLFVPMLIVLIALLFLYIAFDLYYLRKEQKENMSVPIATPDDKKIEILGSYNFLLLAAIIAVILFSGKVQMSTVSILGIHVALQDIIRNVLLCIILIISWLITPQSLRKENEYSWDPILEVGYLFFGIFVTMAPVLAILKAGEAGALGFITSAVNKPADYFWITGILSSFLDNAPTYLTFLSASLGQFYPGVAEPLAISYLIAENPLYLMAVSTGAIFFGAVTYIGNAPNFMVRCIAEKAGVRMPSFFGYMVYSFCILFPLFGLITLLYY